MKPITLDDVILLDAIGSFTCPCGADVEYFPEMPADPECGIMRTIPPSVYCPRCAKTLWEGQTRAERRADGDEARANERSSR